MPRIYVASLSDYNAGNLLGTWIDLPADPDDVQAQIAAMLAQSKFEPAEEWAIHDHDGFEDITIGEYTPIPDVCRIADLLEEHGDAFVCAMGNFRDVDEAEKACRNSYQGAFDSLEDYARQYLDDTGQLQNVPGDLLAYFDFQAFAERELEIGGMIWSRERGGSVHVFSND